MLFIKYQSEQNKINLKHWLYKGANIAYPESHLDLWLDRWPGQPEK
jgi:hypothetical protein